MSIAPHWRSSVTIELSSCCRISALTHILLISALDTLIGKGLHIMVKSSLSGRENVKVSRACGMTVVLECSPKTPFILYYFSLVTPVYELCKTYLGFGMAHFYKMTACGENAWVNLANLVMRVSMSRFVIAFGDPLLFVLCIGWDMGSLCMTCIFMTQSVEVPCKSHRPFSKNTCNCLMVQFVASKLQTSTSTQNLLTYSTDS